MRILVIGGNGFIGTPLVRELLTDGHDVAVFHRGVEVPSNGKPLQIRGDRNRLPDHEDDLRRLAPEVIIDMVLCSGEQAGQLIAVADKINARVVAVSSMDVYRAWGVVQGSELGGLEPMPITEDAPLRTTRQTYPPEVVEKMKSIFTWLGPGYDKIAVEQAVMGRVGNTVVRLPMVYGPGDPLHRQHGVLKRIKDGRAAIILPDDHAAWRGPRGYVENVAHAIALATTERAAGRIYHVCEEPSLTELEWQKEVAAQTEWRGRFVRLAREQAPKHLLMAGNASQHVVPNSQRIRTELAYKELWPIDEAIRRTIVWEQANPPAGAVFHQFDYAAEDAALAKVA